MEQESKKFLQELLSQCGPSGFEEKVQNVWVERSRGYCDEIFRDVHGNAMGVVNAKADFKIMLAGHCDEIGFIISHISDEGYLYVLPIGGIDPSVLPGSQIKIQTSNGFVDGIIGKKPIHLLEKDERERAVQIKDLWVDIGAKDKKDALQYVSVGDAASYSPNFMELKNDLFTSKGCDDKVGAFVVSEVLKKLKNKSLHSDVGVYAVSTVQEEVGLRGATTSAFGIDPRVGIAVDVGFASDLPDIDKRIVGDVKLGQGPILHGGPVINRALGKLLVQTAQDRKIPYQFTSLSRPGGTDTSVIQLTRRGVATALVGVPNRYMHTMVEACSFADLDHCAELIAETLCSITPETDFVPR